MSNEFKSSYLSKRSTEEIDQLVADMISRGNTYRLEKMDNKIREIVASAVEIESRRCAQIVSDYENKINNRFEHKRKRLTLSFFRFLVWGSISLGLIGIACVGKAAYLYLVLK